jgi:hypothetical protein
MNNQHNNILSYFIKDIKDATELAFYKQINHNNSIHIIYKDKKLYKISINNYSWNYIHDIIKHSALKYIHKSNMSYNYKNNIKTLYYESNNNSITFRFNIYNKYLKKKEFNYQIKRKSLLYVYISHYKEYKYIRMYAISANKFTSLHILIPNKYELQYYCKFFNLYFGYI